VPSEANETVLPLAMEQPFMPAAKPDWSTLKVTSWLTTTTPSLTGTPLASQVSAADHRPSAIVVWVATLDLLTHECREFAFLGLSVKHGR